MKPSLEQIMIGLQFKSEPYSCVWTVLRYHRCGNWVCEEPDFKTTCEFHEVQILKGEIILPSQKCPKCGTVGAHYCPAEAAKE